MGVDKDYVFGVSFGYLLKSTKFVSYCYIFIANIFIVKCGPVIGCGFGCLCVSIPV